MSAIGDGNSCKYYSQEHDRDDVGEMCLNRHVNQAERDNAHHDQSQGIQNPLVYAKY